MQKLYQLKCIFFEVQLYSQLLWFMVQYVGMCSHMSKPLLNGVLCNAGSDGQTGPQLMFVLLDNRLSMEISEKNWLNFYTPLCV